jgi:phosphatidyl-myo-inositol dimannoside synthase
MSKTMAIARVFPPEVGGSGRWIWELYSRLPCSEYLVVAHDSAGSREFDKTHKLPIERLSLHLSSWGALGWRRGSAYLAAYRKLRQIVRDHRIVEVHAACCLPEGFLAWIMRRRMGIAYLVYVHGEELNVARSSRELTWMTRRVLRDADLVIANSQNTANILYGGWPISEPRLRVLHPGVDTQKFQPAVRDIEARRRLGWDNRRVVLTVGRLQRRKGHEQLIRALLAIRTQVPDVLYAIVGEGEERSSLIELVTHLGLHNQVRMHGKPADKDLVAAYQQCDLFVLPNREVDGDIEGFGMVLLEAQACGKPVMAGNSGGTAEAMNDPETGLVINCADASLIAAPVQELLLDPDRIQRMGVAARHWVVGHFDWSVLAPAAEQVFAEARAQRFAPAMQTG